MDYKKCWDTLKAESGSRWCQPHQLSNELLTIGELMRNMERRASEQEESQTTDTQHTQPAIFELYQQWVLEEPRTVIQQNCAKMFVQWVQKQQVGA